GGGGGGGGGCCFSWGGGDAGSPARLNGLPDDRDTPADQPKTAQSTTGVDMNWSAGRFGTADQPSPRRPVPPDGSYGISAATNAVARCRVTAQTATTPPSNSDRPARSRATTRVTAAAHR